MTFADYFCKKGCCYWHEFDRAYGKLDVKGKTVIMIGNDCNSTAIYFIIKGARFIEGFEKDPKLNAIAVEVCQHFNQCDKIRLNGEWKGSEYPNGHVLVMDCEGCEDLLDLSRLDQYEQVCIAVHDWARRKSEFIEHFYKNGYEITYVTPDMKEVMFCRHKKDIKT